MLKLIKILIYFSCFQRPQYWLALVVSRQGTLRDLDRFLRDIWLEEVCGHLSAFERVERRGTTFRRIEPACVRRMMGLEVDSGSDDNEVNRWAGGPEVPGWHDREEGKMHGTTLHSVVAGREMPCYFRYDYDFGKSVHAYCRSLDLFSYITGTTTSLMLTVTREINVSKERM